MMQPNHHPGERHRTWGLQNWWILVSWCRGWESSVASSIVAAKARARAASIATATERAGAIAVATARATAQPAEARAVAGAIATAQASIAIASTAKATIVVSVVATHGVGGWGCSQVEKESRSVTWVWTFLPAEGLLYALSVGVTHPSFMPLANFMTTLISLLFTTISWNNREIQQACCVDILVWIPLI